MQTPAFLTPTFTTTFTTSLSRPATSSRPARPVCAPVPQRRQIVCATPTAEKGEKKKAPVKFATDLKGNFVWTLRTATEEDIDAVGHLFATTYPRALVESFIMDSGCCTVCEPSIKGTKEGEGYKSKIMGAALVDVERKVKDLDAGMDGGLMEFASVMGTMVDEDVPDAEVVRKKLLLGAMKKLKLKGVPRITAYVVSPEQKTIDFLKECLFKKRGEDTSAADMICDLIATDPDPEKKMM